MNVRPVKQSELSTVAQMNIHLQQDEGSNVLTHAEALARLTLWLAGTYRCVVFTQSSEVVGYALFRPMDPNTEGHPGGVYVRPFFIVPKLRGRGWGWRAFELMLSDVLPSGCYVVLEALATNPAGQAFWRALGFTEYSIRYKLDQEA